MTWFCPIFHGSGAKRLTDCARETETIGDGDSDDRGVVIVTVGVGDSDSGMVTEASRNDDRHDRE